MDNRDALQRGWASGGEGSSIWRYKKGSTVYIHGAYDVYGPLGHHQFGSKDELNAYLQGIIDRTEQYLSIPGGK